MDTKRYNELTRELFADLMAENKGGNVCFSPLSVLLLLGMSAQATAGSTRDEILKAVDPKAGFEELLSELKTMQESMTYQDVLTMANAVIARSDFSEGVKEEYKKALGEVFKGQYFSTENIIADVDDWVKKQTRGMIEKIADDSMTEPVTCLLNAVAFSDGWQKEYMEDDIGESGFTNADSTVSAVNMMSSNEELYVETDRFVGTVKPYKNSDFAFMPLLPKDETDNLNDALADLDVTEIYRSAEDVSGVVLMLPEFKFDFEKDLTEFCKSMGIRKGFTPEADFSAMSARDLMIGAILHKAHVEVDRKGTRAAAVTAEMVFTGCCPTFRTVILDRPFVFAIMHLPTGLPVFVGAVNKL